MGQAGREQAKTTLNFAAPRMGKPWFPLETGAAATPENAFSPLRPGALPGLREYPTTDSVGLSGGGAPPGKSHERGIRDTVGAVILWLGDKIGKESLPTCGTQSDAPPRMSLHVGIVSHQDLFRILLAEHLVTSWGATVAVSCASGAELLQQNLGNMRLDLLLIDGDGQAGAGEWLRELLKRKIASKTMLFTDRPAAYLVHRVFQLGLNGLFHKRDSREVLHAALSTVLAGGFFITPQVNVAERTQFAQVLSDREAAVLTKLATGLSPAPAARQLSISVGTVLTHRRNFMRKLGLRSQVAVVLFAVRSGLVALEQIDQPPARVARKR